MISDVAVRLARPEDERDWIRLRTELWPDAPADHAREISSYFRDPPERWACLVAEVSHAGLVGFTEVGLRDYAEECTSSPVGYLEGVYVEPRSRMQGVGEALVAAAEGWARTRGCTEMASDRALDNDASGIFHRAVGFAEVQRIVCYRKEL